MKENVRDAVQGSGRGVRKLIVVPVELREANEFVESFHRHSRQVQGHRFSLGASYGDQLVGVAIIGRPIARRLDDGMTLEVTRTCVRPDAPNNVNSFLYGAAWRAARALGYRKVVTYTLSKESGSSLKGAGWKVVGEVKGAGASAWCGPNRIREWQPIYGQQKLRWEIQ